MDCTNIRSLLDRWLTATPYAVIATVGPEGKPWNTPVVVRFDNQGGMYWVSACTSQHSANIRQNPHIFVIVFDSSVPEGEGTGLYMRMYAQEVTTIGAIKRAMATYDTSFFEHPFAHEQFLGKCPQRMYRAEIEEVWQNTAGLERGHYADIRVPIDPKKRASD